MSSSEFDREHDERLRGLPLPEGMIARLKQVAVASDADLDAALRDVTLPTGVLSRLKDITLDDDTLDKGLRDVPVPVGLVARLQQLPPTVAPRRTAEKKGSGKKERVAGLHRLSLAASLLLAIGLSMFGWIAVELVSSYQRGQLAKNLKDQAGRGLVIGQLTPGTNIPTIDEDNGKLVAVPTWPEDFFPWDMTDDVPENGVNSESPMWTDPRFELRKLTERYGIFGADATFDRLPDLSQVSSPLSSKRPFGVSPPRIKGYDLLFATSKGVQPVVSPSVNEALRTCTVPLVVRTESYDLARRLVANGSLPVKDQIRVEEFLAAQEYRFTPVLSPRVTSPNEPRVTSPIDLQVSIRTAAGASPFGSAGTSLLQVAVQTTMRERRDLEPRHITLALDVSASMRHGGRWDMVRRAVSQWTPELGPQDTLSIIVFRQDAELIGTDFTRQQAETIRQLLQSVAPRGSTSIGNGLLAAYGVCQKTSTPKSSSPRRVVLVTDGLAELPREVSERMQNMIGDFFRSNITLDVVELSAESRATEQWRALSRSGGGRLQSASDAESVQNLLREITAGLLREVTAGSLREITTAEASEIVAKDAKLRVEFNPKTVDIYRLIGHDPQISPSNPSVSTTVDLHPGQCATGLFEVKLKGDGGDDVATAMLTWTDAQSGQAKTSTQRISRLQFAKTFRESPLSLQMAAVAAETAEILRESPFAPTGSHTLDRVLAIANTANSQMVDWPGFAELRAFIQQTAKVKSANAKTNATR